MKKNIIKLIVALLIAVVATTAICFLILYIKNSYNIYELKLKETKNEEIKILFVGDIMFDRGIRYFADKNGGNEFILQRIKNVLLNNDLVVANLEGPITDEKSISLGTIPGSKNNYFFTFDKSIAKTLFNHNIRLVGLNNNHILNFGREGLESTKKYLDQATIKYFGAPDEERSIIIDLKGLKIAFVAYNEFTQNYNVEKAETIEEIKNIKKYVDFVVVFCHWGTEYKLIANELQISLAHEFIDTGASLIIGAHPHVVQQKEDYNEKRIYYSLGNFVFDQYFSEDVRKGMGVIWKINKNTKEIKFEEINFYLENNGQTSLITTK